MNSNRKIISLFTGAGGLDLGFEAAGFETAVAVEMDKMCVQTIQRNRNWPIIDRDILEVTTGEILERSGLKKNEAALLVGGPPCQPFSKSGFWATGDSKRLSDPRARTLDEYIRVLNDTLPEAFLLENVAGIAFKGKSEGIEYLKKRILQINAQNGVNYRVEVKRVNAADFGVPQLRERLLVIGHREGKVFGDLKPTHHAKNTSLTQIEFGDTELQPAITSWDAIGHLIPNNIEDLSMSGKWADLLPSIPEGENYLYHTDRGKGKPLFGWRRRFWNFLLKLAKDKPSWTLTAQPGPATGPFHWENRHLSAEELCALQTFPQNYQISGKRSEAQKQVGNAVPSALAELVALKIRSRFFGESAFEDALGSLIPLKRVDRPPAEDCRPVPKKYFSLEGIHEAHPGTGKGYGAALLREKMNG